jgi:hypothetical protein
VVTSPDHHGKVVDAYIAPITAAMTKAHAGAVSAATKAASTLASEVLSAIRLPTSQAIEHLKALGVPASKAAAILHDAVEPFSQAVRALEKAGFSAAEAVKIADAGAKANVAATKTAIKATTASVTSTIAATAGALSGLMVNGIAVSGPVYEAAIGIAYKQQTGRTLGGSAGATSAPSPVTGISTPSMPVSSGPVINFHPGAIVINPAPGNDANSLRETQSMLEQMLREIGSELRGGIAPTMVVR